MDRDEILAQALGVLLNMANAMDAGDAEFAIIMGPDNTPVPVVAVNGRVHVMVVLDPERCQLPTATRAH